MSTSDCGPAVPGRLQPGAGGAEGAGAWLCAGPYGERHERAGGGRQAGEAGARWFGPGRGLPVSAGGEKWLTAPPRGLWEGKKLRRFQEGLSLIVGNKCGAKLR